MTLVLQARKLANFIENLEYFETVTNNNNLGHSHIGALFTDIILQAGLNYKTVVLPRVQNLLNRYPEHSSLEEFEYLVKKVGLNKLIKWNHPEKLKRINALIEFSKLYNINTCDDFKKFLLIPKNQKLINELRGFGPKTIDYTLKLLNIETVAVDRHIYSFVELAEIQIKGYQPTKQVVEYAADFLHISRSSIDYSIWLYMSKKSYINSKNQASIEF